MRTQYPDYIVLKTDSNIMDVGDIDGSWMDRHKVPYLEAAIQTYGCKLEPTGELIAGEDNTVAEVWKITRE